MSSAGPERLSFHCRETLCTEATMKDTTFRYHRVLLKLSGEALMEGGTDPFSPTFLDFLADELSQVHRSGIQLGVVIGGGNIFRGLSGTQQGIDRTTGDYMGMLATVINCLALSSMLQTRQCPTRILSPFPVAQISEVASAAAARTHLDEGKLVLFAGGTGNPYFTTDTTAALRALEAECDILFKATKVDGVYDSDPAHNPQARFLPRVTFAEALEQDLRIMDRTAFALCQENKLPIMVFNIFKPGNILRALRGEEIGSLVS